MNPSDKLRTFKRKIKVNVKKSEFHQEDYYEKVMSKLSFDCKTESSKKSMMFILFVLLNFFESSGNPNAIAEFKIINKKIEMYMYLKENLIITKNYEYDFKKVLRNIASCIQKNIPHSLNEIVINFSFYFPNVNPNLVDDFKPLQDIILSSQDDEHMNLAFDVIQNFFYTMMENCTKSVTLHDLINRTDNLTLHEECYKQYIMSMNFQNAQLFIMALKSLLAHSKIQALFKLKNKCCTHLKAFCFDFEKDCKKESEKNSKTGQNLLTPKDIFGRNDCL